MISAEEIGNAKSYTSFFRNRRVLVTGGTGLIGRAVVDIISNLEAEITVVSLDRIKENKKVEYIYGDLTSFEFCLEVTKGIDFVFHLAGIKGSIEVTKTRPASFLVPMLMFNTNILEAARLNQVSKLVYTSSIGAYSSAEIFEEAQGEIGEPMDMYPGWAKRMAELQIRSYAVEYGLDWSVVRPCNVYGPGDNFDPENAMVIPSLMMRIHKGERPLKVWGDGSAIRDFAFSRDVATGTIQALIHGTRGSFINLGSGVGYSIKELVETLNQVVPFEYEFDTTKSGGFPKRVMSIERARDWVGFEPKISLLHGLQETWNWFQSHQTEYLLRKNYFASLNT